MNCEDVNRLWLDYLDNDLDATDRTAIENHLAHCKSCADKLEQFKTLNRLFQNTKKVESSQFYKNDFFIALNNEKAKESKTGFRPGSMKNAIKVAASILLFVGGTIFGSFIRDQGTSKTRISVLENEIMSLKQQVALEMLKEQQTASERLQAVNYVFEQGRLNREVSVALYNSLISDENSSVRLEAALTLKRFSNDEAVRKMLIKSLEYQSDPYVQIKLIQILSKFNENDSRKAIRVFLKQENLNPAVKDFGQKML
jgi:hypothetical protein